MLHKSLLHSIVLRIMARMQSYVFRTAEGTVGLSTCWLHSYIENHSLAIAPEGCTLEILPWISVHVVACLSTGLSCYSHCLSEGN